MFKDGQIAFVEFPGRDLDGMRRFYGGLFGWAFGWAVEDRGHNYVVFRGNGAEGGFSAHPTLGPVEPLVVLYASDLEAARDRVRLIGGEITRDIYPSRGGYRFHVRDPGENEVAVWSETRRPPPALAMRSRWPVFRFPQSFHAQARPPRSGTACPEPAPTQPAPTQPAPTQPATPLSRPIPLTAGLARPRTNHELWRDRLCARMARSTM
jgi:predicted enzyme related to lactoylglutathione lyase